MNTAISQLSLKRAMYRPSKAAGPRHATYAGTWIDQNWRMEFKIPIIISVIRYMACHFLSVLVGTNVCYEVQYS